MRLRIAGAIAALVLLSLACGMLEVSVEGTASPDFAATGTVGALQTQNAELATRAAAPTPAPVVIVATPSGTTASGTVPTPTASAVPATRITFLNGATVGVVSAPIGAAQTQSYVLDIFQAQPMIVELHSANNDVTVSIRHEDGTTLLAASSDQKSWRGNLPKTGDYYLTVHGGASPENFTLVVTIPLPLRFAPGADSLTVQGSTVAGYNVSYAVYALKGQAMDVTIESISSKGSLAVYGLQDGQQYLRSDEAQKSFHLVLPSTQDYIISIVPFQGLVLDYITTITVK